jgi:hypothetical protein
VTKEVFGDPVFRALVVAHAVAAIVLAGSTGHVAVLAFARLRGREVPAARIVRHLRASAVAFGASFVLGLIAYPHYRYHVRGLVLDAQFPWASNLFDLKENVAALVIPLLIGTLSLERSGESPRASAALILGLSALVFFIIVSGIIVTSVRGA